MHIRLLLPTLLLACGEAPMDSEPAKAAVRAAFEKANPPGRTGLLLKGHHVWLEAEYFVPTCLESKDLAFNDDPRGRPTGGGGRITPTYAAQRWLVADTDKGFCVLLGVDPKIELGEVSYGGDVWRVKTQISMGTPSPWFECLDPKHTSRVVEVRYDKEGKANVETDLGLFQGDCPHPLPVGEDRTPKASSASTSTKAPTKAEIVELVTKFDAALDAADHASAREMTSCVNLFESPVFGTCSLGEFLTVGPAFASEMKPRHGTPWLEYGLKKPEDIGTISKDAKDPSLFHVNFTHARTGKNRSFSVQHRDGGWKMFGVVETKGEGLTPVRYLLDLHERERRDILQRRMAGEKLDARGISEEAPAPTE